MCVCSISGLLNACPVTLHAAFTSSYVKYEYVCVLTPPIICVLYTCIYCENIILHIYLTQNYLQAVFVRNLCLVISNATKIILCGRSECSECMCIRALFCRNDIYMYS